MDVLARGCYATFWFKDISAQGQNVFCFTWCQNLHVLKGLCVKISKSCNNPLPKRPWCWNIPVPKCSRAKMSGAKIRPSHINTSITSPQWLKFLPKDEFQGFFFNRNINFVFISNIIAEMLDGLLGISGINSRFIIRLWMSCDHQKIFLKFVLFRGPEVSKQ